MIVPYQKPFSFKQIEIVNMVLSQLYFLNEALLHFGEESGMKVDEQENESVKYELWKQGISLSNYNFDKIFVEYFIDRINFHVRLQKSVKKSFKLDLKNNPFIKMEISKSMTQVRIFNKWFKQKFKITSSMNENIIKKIIDIENSIFIDDNILDPAKLMKEGNRIWKEYKFNEVYTLPKMKQLSDYKYTELKPVKKKNS